MRRTRGSDASGTRASSPTPRVLGTSWPAGRPTRERSSGSGSTRSSTRCSRQPAPKVVKSRAKAYAFDALIEIARRASRAGDGDAPTDGEVPTPKKRPSPRFMGLVRIDHAALRRGTVEGDEICEIAGLGPIPVSVARDLLGDAVLKLVITKGVDVANVTHLGRSPTVAQQVALWWQSPMCAREDCTRT